MDEVDRQSEFFIAALQNWLTHTRQVREYASTEDIGPLRESWLHDHLGINVNRVWELIEDHQPDLRAKVAAMLAELGPA